MKKVGSSVASLFHERLRRIVTILSVILLVAACSSPSPGQPVAKPVKPLKVGWQPPWANQGQLVAILKHTDLLSKAGVKVEFVPFTYGGPMMEAALARRLDVVLAGEQPVLNLLSKSRDFRIVARMTRYRSAIVVPADSPMTTLADLKGKTLATAFGSTTHRDVVKIFAEAGLEDKVSLVSLDQAEHAAVMQKGGSKRWGELDAIGTYDPTIAAGVAAGHARILHAWASPALVAARAQVIAEQRAELQSFLRAYATSYTVYAANPARANAWYTKESRLPLSDAQYAEIAAFEPNLRVTDVAKLDLAVTDELLALTARNADVALRLEILKTKPDLAMLSDRSLLP